MEMEQFFLDFADRLGALHANLHQLLAEFPEEALDWSPTPDMNSVAVLITHLVGAERFWLGDVAAGEPSGRVRSTEFQVQNRTGAELKTLLDNSMTYSLTVLSRLSLADLSTECSSPQHKETFSVGWCLLHVLEHTAEHTGHVQLMRQLWEQRA